jgi:hypothetical protein
MPVILNRITRTALLSASHSSPGLPPRQRPRQRARCCLRLFCRRLSVVSRNFKFMLIWLVWMVMPVILNRITRTALLSASHSSPGLPARQRPRQRARCCLRLFCRRLSVCRTCTCMLVWLMPVMVDRMTRTASLSASHSSPGLPPHHRQRARCWHHHHLRLFCHRLSVVCRNCTCMLVWLMLVMLDRIMRTAWLSASHSSPGLPARQRPRQRARCCLRLFCRRLSVV